MNDMTHEDLSRRRNGRLLIRLGRAFLAVIILANLSACEEKSGPVAEDQPPQPPAQNTTAVPQATTAPDEVMNFIQRGEHDRLLEYLQAGGDPNWRTDRDLSLLAWASVQGQSQAVETLLHFGAEVDAPVRANNTALHWAVRGDSVDVARILLDNGANVNVLGGPNRDLSPMQLAINRGNQDMVELLRQYGGEP
jgi:uncharacterized protein